MGTQPNFLIIGAAKAGTTSIAQYLDQHPQIYISPVKEPFYFSFQGQDIDFAGPGDRHSLRLAVTQQANYDRLFEGVDGEIAIGEASTSYLYTPNTAARIYKQLPDVKLIAILRNPVETAYSSFVHQRREGFEPESSFAKALEQEPTRIVNNWMFFWHYRQNGFYYHKLKPYYELFPVEQIKVYLFDDFKREPLHFMRTLFSELGVETSFAPDLSVKYNISGVPRSRILHKLTSESRWLKQLLRPLVPQAMRQKVRRINLEKPAIEEEVKRQLAQAYRNDILSLQDLIKKDLSSWIV